MKTAPTGGTVDVKVTIIILYKFVHGLQRKAIIVNWGTSLVQAARRLAISVDVTISAGLQKPRIHTL